MSMARIRRILCAADLSRASRGAFALAVTLAKAHHAGLTVLYVMEPVTPILPEEYLASPTWERIDKDTRAWARRHLQALVQQAKAQGVRATARMANGAAAAEIVKATRLTRSDLVVVGTHGRSGLSKFFLGSVAQRVVATARCPVVTVPSASPRTAPRRA
jgi:nucleotide-binding universal stress UspA family protein